MDLLREVYRIISGSVILFLILFLLSFVCIVSFFSSEVLSNEFQQKLTWLVSIYYFLILAQAVVAVERRHKR